MDQFTLTNVTPKLLGLLLGSHVRDASIQRYKAAISEILIEPALTDRSLFSYAYSHVS